MKKIICIAALILLGRDFSQALEKLDFDPRDHHLLLESAALPPTAIIEADIGNRIMFGEAQPKGANNLFLKPQPSETVAHVFLKDRQLRILVSGQWQNLGDKESLRFISRRLEVRLPNQSSPVFYVPVTREGLTIDGRYAVRQVSSLSVMPGHLLRNVSAPSFTGGLDISYRAQTPLTNKILQHLPNDTEVALQLVVEMAQRLGKVCLGRAKLTYLSH